VSFDPEGTYLAFDTSISLGSVALWKGGDVVARAFLTRQGEHASRLIPAIQDCLARGEVNRSDLEGLVVGHGPGSFTGVRVAVATAKGLVAGLGLPLWSFSSLEASAFAGGCEMPQAMVDALAGEAFTGADAETASREPLDSPADGSAGAPTCVLFDARGDRVYAAIYAPRGEALVEPEPATLGEVLGDDRLPRTTRFAGDGALRHATAIRAAGFAVMRPPVGFPLAEAHLRLLVRELERPPVDEPNRWEPTYLRDTSARPSMPAIATPPNPAGSAGEGRDP
jgi:tRNA threonylcarbamoyl adenosine modification protein YeaZ